MICIYTCILSWSHFDMYIRILYTTEICEFLCLLYISMLYYTRYTQMASGVSIYSYWLATWIWDFISYQVRQYTVIMCLHMSVLVY